MSEGDDVLYNGKETYVCDVYEDGKILIVNPDFDWKEEDDCIRKGIEYTTPYYLILEPSELTIIPKQSK